MNITRKNRLVFVGVRVQLNERGVKWAKNCTGVGGLYTEWNNRAGVLHTISLDCTRARVIWDGCRAPADYVPMQFLEEVPCPAPSIVS